MLSSHFFLRAASRNSASRITLRENWKCYWYIYFFPPSPLEIWCHWVKIVTTVEMVEHFFFCMNSAFAGILMLLYNFNFPPPCDLIKSRVHLTALSLSPTLQRFLELCFLMCYVSRWGPTAVPSPLEEALLHCAMAREGVPWCFAPSPAPPCKTEGNEEAISGL